MKSRSAFLAMTAMAAMVFGVFGQEISRVEQFRELPPNEALLVYKNSNDRPDDQLAMMRWAFQSERTDLILSLFREHRSNGHIFQVANEEPESEFKNQIVLAMLRSDSWFWPIEPPIVFGSRPGDPENAVEPFVGMIRKLLPSVAISNDLFYTKAKRLQLAKDLESAIAEERAASGKEVQPEVEDGLPEEESDSLTAKTDPRSMPEGETPKPGALGNQVVLVVITLGVIALVWLVVRLRGRR